MHLNITMNDVLKRNTFSKAKIAAGSKGLNRLVKWVHVMEVTQIGNLLNGNELILSTGMAWKDNEQVFLSFVLELIELNVSGLCIELGTQLSAVPSCILETAEKHGFPIILFEEEVRFIDITQDLHTYLIQQHYEMITKLESFSQALNQILLSPNPQENILNLLHNSINMQVVFIHSQKNVTLVPALDSSEQENLLVFIEQEQETSFVVRQPIQVLDHPFAELILCSKDRPMTDLHVLLADRTATALANQLLREMYAAEKKRAEENTWMQEWLEGRHRDDEIEKHLSYLGMKGRHQGASVFCVEMENREAGVSETQYPYIQIVIRSIFEPLGFYILPYVKSDHLIFILINLREVMSYKERVRQGILLARENQKLPSLFMAVGKRINRLGALDKSYNTALNALMVQTKLPNGKSSPLYDDLHMYRLISMIQDKHELEDFIQDYLRPVIEYDAKNNTRLLTTLKVFLMCGGSKQETAGQLYIVRQTLYHRIKQLEELLGKDFMEPGKRQAVEFAAMAHEYLELP
ncbi:PucR family transcriptional regulator [Fictibacillus terranigra]|uniref:PucR family transcriptional regulator ligand-binding domain-containing protein n=1 Tax=Fictibacillus terranigra TaxID=3058424 RepID=A0ABT8E975_9BACL|nr:PucR family transcriptional regulator [Fictibacillus sp. CENA-BCM004]MDN4074466.1 PucR family transcriptional regulator ligand-binding domain-containing protein [Fictibacillus sp. CENA-BCM004]